MRELNRVRRLKYLFVTLGILELGLLISCINRNRTNEFGRPIDAESNYGYDDIQLNSYGLDADPNFRTPKEQLLKEAEGRNSAILGLDAVANEIIP